jgi:hypothetical protein
VLVAWRGALDARHQRADNDSVAGVQGFGAQELAVGGSPVSVLEVAAERVEAALGSSATNAEMLACTVGSRYALGPPPEGSEEPVRAVMGYRKRPNLGCAQRFEDRERATGERPRASGSVGDSPS